MPEELFKVWESPLVSLRDSFLSLPQGFPNGGGRGDPGVEASFVGNLGDVDPRGGGLVLSCDASDQTDFFAATLYQRVEELDISGDQFCPDGGESRRQKVVHECRDLAHAQHEGKYIINIPPG